MLTAKEVAEKMGVGRSEVYRLANRRDGLKAYKVGAQLRFKPEEVEEYMRQPSEPKPAGRPKRLEPAEQPEQVEEHSSLSNLIVGIKFS